MTKIASQSDIATLAVFLLGGINRFVDTEDVAVKAHELAPDRFSWRKYPDQINLELVRVALSDAKKAEKGAYLMGSGRKGWSLTVKGKEWVDQNGHLVDDGIRSSDHVSRAGSIDAVRTDRESKRLQSTDAWQYWQTDESKLTTAQAREVFRIDSYTKPEAIELKINRLSRLFSQGSVESRFLSEMSQLIHEDEKE